MSKSWGFLKRITSAFTCIYEGRTLRPRGFVQMGFQGFSTKRGVWGLGEIDAFRVSYDPLAWFCDAVEWDF